MAKSPKKKASAKKSPAKSAAKKVAKKSAVKRAAKPAVKKKAAVKASKPAKTQKKSAAKVAAKKASAKPAKKPAGRAEGAKKKASGVAKPVDAIELKSRGLEVPAPEPTHLPLEREEDAAESYDEMDEELGDSGDGATAAPREISRAAMTSSATSRSDHADPSASRAFAIDAARMLRDDKCEEVVLLDVRELGQVSDFIIIASGTSDRQMRSVAKNVEDLGAKTGFNVYRREVDDRATWIIADFVDIVVHLFEPNTRSTYDLENLWADAPRIRWERPDQVVRDRVAAN